MNRLQRSGILICCAMLGATSRGAAQEPAIKLDTVAVTVASLASAEMASATRGVQVVTAEQIANLPARTIPDVLQWALGVDAMPRSPALVDVGLRGSSFEQVLVMVDGIRVSDSQTGHFDLNLAVPLDQVDRIELLRGPASTMHGSDAVGGVINIVTRRGGGTRARVETGTFGSAGAAFAHTLQGGRTRTDIGVDLRRSDGHRAGTDYEMLQGRVAVATPLGARRLDAAFAWAGRNFGANGFYGSDPDWNEYEKTRAATASVALRAPADARLAIEPVLSMRRHHDDFVLLRDDPSYYQNRHTTDQIGGKLSARYAPSPLLRLAAGTEAYHDRLESSSLGDRSESQTAVLAELAVGRVGQLTAVAGARLDWHEAHGSFLSPAFSAGWWPLSPVRVRASVGRALRTPTWTERYYRDPANEGSADLAPEHSWSGEVGIDVTPTPGMQIGIAAFQREAEALIDWARPAGSDDVWVTTNVESARFRGIEAQLSLVDPLGTHWSTQGSWLGVTSATPAGVESKYALRPLVESLALAVNRELPAGVGLSLRAVRSRRVGEDAYLRADARASVERSALRLYLDVRNLGDTRYLDITQVAAAGRSLTLGLEWRRP